MGCATFLRLFRAQLLKGLVMLHACEQKLSHTQNFLKDTCLADARTTW
jgi:hypothetical protein